MAHRPAVYSARILKGAGLVPYTKELLADWDESRPVRESLASFRRSGIFGRASAARAGDILAILEERYLKDETVRRALTCLRRGRPEPPLLEMVLGYHAALVDPLLHDFAIDLLHDRRQRGIGAITAEDVALWLRNRGLDRPPYSWSMRTIPRVARQLLTAWRDFGLLAGASHKRITDRPVPVPAFVWIATHRRQVADSASALFSDPAFRLLLLTPLDVEAMFVAAARQGWLDFQGGGQLARIDWKYETVEEVAHALT